MDVVSHDSGSNDNDGGDGGGDDNIGDKGGNEPNQLENNLKLASINISLNLVHKPSELNLS